MSRRGLFRDTSSGVIDDGLTSVALATTSDLAGYQPLDSDLTAIAALTTTTFGRALLALADAAALRTDAGLVIGTDVEAHDPDLTAIAGLAPTNDDILQRKAGAWTNRTMAQLIADLGALGTTFQPLDSDLTAIAALSTTTFGRSLLTSADAAAARTALGLGTAATHATGDYDAAGAAAAAQAASQPLDSDLTAIAALDSSTSGAIASDGAGWVKKTYAQFKTALALVKADVGLGSVDNTADLAKNVASAAILTTARNIDGVSFNGSADVAVIAPGTHAAASKATPVDADELPLVDSAASNVLKKLTLTNLKAFLKTYFDTKYAPVGYSAQFVVQNTASLATLISQSIPGNTLGATGGLLVTIAGYYQNNTGSLRTITFKITFGTTVLWGTVSGSQSSNALQRSFHIQFLLSNRLTNDQRMGGRLSIGSVGAGSIAGQGSWGNDGLDATVIYGEGVEDTTSAKTLLVECQHSASNVLLILVGTAHIQVVP